MNVNEMKKASFESVSLQDWKAIAEESLKGKPIEKLYKETYEGITLKPLYTKGDIKAEWTANRKASKRDWKIAQRVTRKNPEDLPEMLQTVLSRGQDTVSFADPDGSINRDILQKIFTLAVTEKKPLFQFTSISSDGFEVLKEGFPEMRGTYSADPIPSLIEESSSDTVQAWIETITYLKERAPEVRTVMVDTSLLSEAGANAVQELAYAVSAGVSIIELLTNKGWRAEEAADKLVFNFAMGSRFFTEISKLRAFRILWGNISEAYGFRNMKATISAETAGFTKSKLDPYVNMLRSGNETFAAVLGGADYIHVSPYDQVYGETSDFSERIARNTQLILSQESHLDKVSDPAGGSYYIETLTNSLAEEAWKSFQEIDRSGGLIKALKEGTVQRDIQRIFNKRRKDAASRKQSVVGTNVYANLEEVVPVESPAREKVQLAGLQSLRLSESFETLRERAAKLKDKPQAGLILLGDIKNHKVRADFVSGYLAAGGIGVLPSGECQSVANAVEFVNGTNVDYYVICGLNQEYDTMAKDIVKSVKNSEQIIDIAGTFEDKEMNELRSAGLNGNIFLGQDMFEKLDALLSRWEAKSNGK
ncbi:methylmalonyl-CoA mutase subunit beta [Bacillus sp. SCS-153A]|uniref:methylmalonyl-CoA mutase subunit beta n=1 Tax=Rossellomorea sedimentorum TaxID=3115294 RepID=UPI003905FA02